MYNAYILLLFCSCVRLCFIFIFCNFQLIFDIFCSSDYHSVNFLSATIIQVPPQSYSCISPTFTTSTNNNIRMQSPSVKNNILREQNSNAQNEILHELNGIAHNNSEPTRSFLLTKYERMLIDIESRLSSARYYIR